MVILNQFILIYYGQISDITFTFQFELLYDSYKQFSKDKFPNLFSTFYKYFGYAVSEVFKFVEEYFTGGVADSQTDLNSKLV